MDDQKEPKKWLPPGSIEAREGGCTCPMMDNEYGRGAFLDGKVFFVNKTCPLHGNSVWMSTDTPAASKD